MNNRTTNIDRIFILWLLALPFNQFDIYGSLSLDNILTILLVILIPVQLITTNSTLESARRVRIVITLVIIHLMFLIMAFTSTGTFSDMLKIMIPEVKFKLYFIIPLLFISTIYQYKRTLVIILIDGIVIASFAFLQAVDIIHLEFSRSVAGDRLGLEGIGRSAGLLANYGDMAIMLTFSLFVLLYLIPKPIKINPLVKLLMIVILLAGVIASQSRNVVLSIIIGYVSYRVMMRIIKMKGSERFINYFLIFVAGVTALIAGYVLYPFLLDLILGSGGTRQSVMDRWDSYIMSLELIFEHPLFGLPTDKQMAYMGMIAGIHNMWLLFMLKGGVLSIIPLIILFSLAFRWSIGAGHNKDRKVVSSIVASMVIVLLASSMAYVVVYSNIFWAIFGLLISYGAVKNEERIVSSENIVIDKTKPRILRKKLNHDGNINHRNPSE